MRHEENLLIEDHAADGMRSGEGATVELNDGTLMLVYSDFCGGGDFSAARLLIRRSVDGARSWSEPELFFNPEPGWINVMSVSMLRLHDGRLAAVFAGQIERDVCVSSTIVA